MWKVGDKLYCHTKAYNAIGNEIFNVGKYYTIDSINEYKTFFLTNEGQSYACKNVHISNYFMSLSEYRKLKLEKINEA